MQIAQDVIPETRLFALEYAQAAPLSDAFEHVPNAAGLQDLKDLALNECANTETVPSLPTWGWSAVAAVAAFALGAFLFAGQASKAKPSWQS